MNLGAARYARPETSTTGTQLPRIALTSVSTPGENHSFRGLLTLDSFLCLAQRVLIHPGGAWGSTWVRLPGLLARAREHRSGSPPSGHSSCSTSSHLLSARLRGLGPSYSDSPSSSRRTLNSRPVPAPTRSRSLTQVEKLSSLLSDVFNTDASTAPRLIFEVAVTR